MIKTMPNSESASGRQLSIQVRKEALALAKWKLLAGADAASPELPAIFRFLADSPAVAWKQVLRPLERRFTVDSPSRWDEMLLGPAITTPSFPRPVGKVRICVDFKTRQYLRMVVPLDCWIQLDLSNASRRMSINLGSGVLQLWSSRFGSVEKPVLRVIDRKKAQKEKCTPEFGELYFSDPKYPLDGLDDVWADFDGNRFLRDSNVSLDLNLGASRKLWNEMALRRLGKDDFLALVKITEDPYLTTRPAGWIPGWGDPGRPLGKRITDWVCAGLMAPASNGESYLRTVDISSGLWSGTEGKRYKTHFTSLKSLLKMAIGRKAGSCYLGGTPKLLQSDYREDWYEKGWRCLYNFDGPEDLFNLGDSGTGQIFYRKRAGKPVEFQFDWSCF